MEKRRVYKRLSILGIILILLGIGIWFISSKTQIVQKIQGVPSFASLTSLDLRTDQAMGPLALAFDPKGEFAYVTVPKGDCMCEEPAGEKSAVAIIRLSDNKLLDTIFVDGSVLDVKVTPDGRFLYVTNAYDDTISVYSTTTKELVATIAAGPDIPPKDESQFPIPYTYKPTFLVFSADGKYAAVSMAKGAALGLIDVSTHTLVDRIKVVTDDELDPENPFAYLLWGIASHPSKNLVFVGGKMAGEIFVIDLDQKKVVKTITLPEAGVPMGLEIEPRGEFLYISDGRNGDILLLDANTFKITGKIPLSVDNNTPEWISFDSQRRFAYITHRKSDTICVVDTKTKKQITTLKGEARPFMAKVTPDGKYLLVTNREGESLQIFKIQ